MNIGYGPWMNSSWFAQMGEEAGHIACRAKEDDPVLMRLWDDIILDKRASSESLCDSLTGKGGREEFLKSLLIAKPFTEKGPKASCSRWWSWCESQDFWDEQRHT